MGLSKDKYLQIKKELEREDVTLVAVSKMKPVEDILELYNLGHRDFGENYVQELVDKQSKLPADIHWHFIGHLQSNKVKYIVPFVHLIHGIDSLKLLKEVNKQAGKAGRKVEVLLQVHIAQEETKFGFDENGIDQVLNSAELNELQQVKIKGLMGMASLTSNQEQVKKEFQKLGNIFKKYSYLDTINCHFEFLSMGMSDDYRLAVEQGSNMVRIGSLIFGRRKG